MRIEKRTGRVVAAATCEDDRSSADAARRYMLDAERLQALNGAGP
jgi:hypothetical protein